MGRALESFRKKVQAHLDSLPHGGIGAFCEDVGVSRTAIQGWQKGAAPSLDIIERVAEQMKIDPWDLIRPTGVAPSAPEITLADIMAELKKIERAMSKKTH